MSDWEYKMETGGFEKLCTVLICFVVLLLILMAALLVFHANKIGTVILIVLAVLFILLVIHNYPRGRAQSQPNHVDSVALFDVRKKLVFVHCTQF